MGKQAAQQQKQGRPATEAVFGKPQPQSAQKPAAAAQKAAAKPQLPSSDEDEDNEHDGDEEADEEDDEMGDDGSYDSAEEEEGLEDLGEFLGFWSNKVLAGEDGIDVCAGHMRVLKITTAALGLDAPKGARSSLVVRVPRQQPEEDEEDEAEPEDEDQVIFDEFVICTLSEARPDVQLELFYTGTEYVQLKVVGNSSIDLTGAVTYMDTGVGGEDEYDEGDEHAGPEEDEEEEEGLYDEDGEVVQGAHAFADDSEEDSEAEADAHGAAAVHRRDAAKAAGKRSAAKKALPSIIQELMGGAGASDEDQEDANESFRPDADDDDEDEDDEDAESEDDASELSDLLSPENAERARQKLKGKIEVVNSPQQKPAAPKSSPQQKPAPAPKSPQQKPAAAAAAVATPSNKRKNDESASAAAAPAVAPQTPANKKAKTDGAAKTPAAAGTPAAGAFQCLHCPRAFQQEAALKQHTVTKHAAATPKKA